jgi:hypothetical protein
MTDQSIGLLIKLKNRMKTEVDGEITEREFSVQIKVSPEMYSTCFTGINQGDELMVSGYIVVDTIMIEGREHPLDYMRVVATSKLAHIPKPLKVLDKVALIRSDIKPTLKGRNPFMGFLLWSPHETKI